jgi:hypothetical protein
LTYKNLENNILTLSNDDDLLFLLSSGQQKTRLLIEEVLGKDLTDHIKTK